MLSLCVSPSISKFCLKRKAVCVFERMLECDEIILPDLISTIQVAVRERSQQVSLFSFQAKGKSSDVKELAGLKRPCAPPLPPSDTCDTWACHDTAVTQQDTTRSGKETSHS